MLECQLEVTPMMQMQTITCSTCSLRFAIIKTNNSTRPPQYGTYISCILIGTAGSTLLVVLPDYSTTRFFPLVRKNQTKIAISIVGYRKTLIFKPYFEDRLRWYTPVKHWQVSEAACRDVAMIYLVAYTTKRMNYIKIENRPRQLDKVLTKTADRPFLNISVQLSI